MDIARGRSPFPPRSSPCFFLPVRPFAFVAVCGTPARRRRELSDNHDGILAAVLRERQHEPLRRTTGSSRTCSCRPAAIDDKHLAGPAPAEFNGKEPQMRALVPAILVAAGLVMSAPAQAQSVKHIQSDRPGGIADGVWVGDTLYLSGQLPSPNKPADRAAGTPAVWGNATEQADSAFKKIEELLKQQGLGLGDIVMMRVYMVAGPDGKLDFQGMNAAYNKYFGTTTQPNKPARSTVQVAALVTPGALMEVEVQAARHK
jgi:enamine deaminase RidA (YjgF/YER057c/UK114 family)